MNPEGFRFLLSALASDRGPRADPTGRGNAQVVAEAIRIARANGLYYPFVARLVESNGGVTATEAETWAAEQTLRACFLETIRFLNEVSADNGLDYLVIKDCPTIEHVPRDVDILVRGEDRDAFVHSLQEHGLELEYSSPAETSLRGAGRLRVDVYSEIRYLGTEFVSVGFLWHSRRILPTHGIPHPGLAPEATHLLNLIHAFLGRGSLSLLELLDFQGLEPLMTDPRAPRAEAEARGWGRVYDLLIADLARLRAGIFDEHRVMQFPHRYGRGFVLDCVSELDVPPRTREAIALRATLLWDDVLFRLEDSGIADRIRKSAVAVRLGNSVGHRLRSMRGDRKVGPNREVRG